MRDPSPVSGFQRLCDLDARSQRFIEGQRASRQAIRECLALDEFERQETAISKLTKVVDGGDVWMAQCCEYFGFAPKS